MRYIDKNKQQLIIDTPIHKSTTKFVNKDGKTKNNIKYVAHIPSDLLVFLLEKFRTFDATSETDAEYINAMLSGNEKIYLSFYNHPGKDTIELTATHDKYVKDDTLSVTVKKQSKVNSYVFTISKKLFKELKDNSDVNYVFRFILPLKDNEFYLKNSVLDVMLV